MNLHKCIVHPGIRTSERFGRINFLQRDLFYGLLSCTQGKGDHNWFEANPVTLRAALFAPCLGKVSERDINDGLLKLREVGLIKLWTGRNGRGYGTIINYRQRFDYGDDLPADAKPPDDELFADTGAPPGAAPPPAPPPNRIEVSVKAPPAPDSPSLPEAAWLAKLARENPHLNVRAELTACLTKYPRASRTFFEDSWLKNAEEPMRPHHDAATTPIEEPEGFKAWAKKRYGKDPKPWDSFSESERDYLLRLMKEDRAA